MIYAKDQIIKLSDEVEEYEFFLKYGHGVMESPHKSGKVIKILKCSEFEAFIISANMNIEMHGTISERDGWEEPNFTYRKK